jgi:sulfonate transport system permease protein
MARTFSEKPQPRVTLGGLARAVNLPGLGVIAVLLAAWQLIVSAKVIDFASLPGPAGIVAGLGQLLREDGLWGPLGHTVLTAAIAWALAVSAGTVAGLLIGLNPRVASWGYATIDILRSLPVIAFVPIAILIWGPAGKAEVLVAAYAAIWPMLVNTSQGVRGVTPAMRDVARTLRLSRSATIRKIVIPAATAPMLVGARIALGICVVVTVVTEMIGPPLGLGYGLISAQSAQQPEQMWALVLVVGITGAALNAALTWLTRLAFPGVATAAARSAR